MPLTFDQYYASVVPQFVCKRIGAQHHDAVSNRMQQLEYAVSQGSGYLAMEAIMTTRLVNRVSTCIARGMTYSTLMVAFELEIAGSTGLHKGIMQCLRDLCVQCYG